MPTPMTWAVLAAIALATASGRADDVAQTIRVTGEGTASAQPDMATIQTGVVTQAATAKEAVAANNKAMDALLAELKKRQIDAKDIQTSQFSVQPMYKHDQQGRTLPETIGYGVSNQVRVRVRKLASLGEVLDALVKAGSNQLSGVSFGIADPTNTLDEARTKAIGDARHRAEVYAKAAGVRLGKVRSISEQPIQGPQPHFLGGPVAVREMAAVPVATGEEEFRVTIQVVFALEDAK